VPAPSCGRNFDTCSKCDGEATSSGNFADRSRLPRRSDPSDLGQVRTGFRRGLGFDGASAIAASPFQRSRPLVRVALLMLVRCGHEARSARRHLRALLVSDITFTPNLASSYCPSCDPKRDPLQEILTVDWCDAHRPQSDGPDDQRATLGRGSLSAVGEAEAETNRLWCELIHRTLNHSNRAPRARRSSRSSRGRPGRG